jgi:hypothetical protein
MLHVTVTRRLRDGKLVASVGSGGGSALAWKQKVRATKKPDQEDPAEFVGSAG